MNIEDEPTARNSATDVVERVKAGLLRSIHAILNRAERNHRLLILEETRMLRELTTVYVMFCKMHATGEENKVIVVKPKYPPWLQEELDRREAVRETQKSIT